MERDNVVNHSTVMRMDAMSSGTEGICLISMVQCGQRMAEMSVWNVENRQSSDIKQANVILGRAPRHPAGCGSPFLMKTVVNYAIRTG